jgi:hypothetical protein
MALFRPLTGKVKTYPIMGFDVEGIGGDRGFVCGSIVSDYTYRFYTDREEMFRDILYYVLDGFWIFAHNLQYDAPILEGARFPRGEMLFTQYGLLWIEYSDGKRAGKVYDSSNLFPKMGVNDLGDMVGYPKIDIDRGILRRLASGTEFSQFNPPDQATIKRYNQRDAEIVFMAVSQFQEIINRMGGRLRPTISGVSMDIFRRAYQVAPWVVVGEKTNQFIRGAYHGGRNENFAVGKVRGCNLYDVTSLYPYLQSKVQYPVPGKLEIDLLPASPSAWIKREGVVSCIVEIPDTFIPPLPYRFDKRLFFPTGKVTGEWTILEIRHALDHGVKLLSTDWVLSSRSSFNPFERFVDGMFAQRALYAEMGSPNAGMVKLLMNSLYGRWGLNVQNGLYKLQDIEDDYTPSKYKGWSVMVYNRRLLGYGGIEVTKQPDYVNVFIAAQIAAAGRCYLYDELELQGESSIYCDTDSIITRGQIATGEGLGCWRQQMTDGEADILTLKEYALYSRNNDPRYVVKGVPAEVAKMYLTQGVARYKRALGVREAIALGKSPATWVDAIKAKRNTLPKRYPVPPWYATTMDFTQTRPYRLSELPLVVSGLYLPPDYQAFQQVPFLSGEGQPSQGSLFGG